MRPGFLRFHAGGLAVLRHTLGLLLLGSVMAADSVVVFNEVHYHPAANEAAEEWVELHNQMAVDIDLSAWRITGTIEVQFPEGTILPGGGYLVVARNPETFRARLGESRVAGPFAGRLNNAGGRLDLRDRNDRLMDRLDYADHEPWPVGADGSGVSAAKREPNLPSADPANWTSSVVIGGTPGRRNFPESFAAQSLALVPFDALWRFEAGGVDPGAAWRELGFDDWSWGGRNEAVLESYWPFDGQAQAVKGVDGVVAGAKAAPDRMGRAGGALAFDGSAAQYVAVPGGGGLDGAAEGTVSLWVAWKGQQRPDCCGTYGAILARQGNGLFSDNILALNHPDPAVAQVVWRQSGGPAPVLLTGHTAVGTSWHHLAVTFAPTGSVLYVDGVAEVAGTGEGMHANPGVPLSIGGWIGDGSGYASASIDDVAVWDRALSAAQIAQLAQSIRSPLDFAAPEGAVYYAGDGRLAASDGLRRTELPLGPMTYYFRHAFRFDGDPGLAQLRLDFAVNDGAVFYLNGTEIYRYNLPPGDIAPGTPALPGLNPVPRLSAVALPGARLGVGTNLLAVEVHQATRNDTGMVFGAGLTAMLLSETNQPQDFLPGDLRFNEVSGRDGPLEIELVNQGPSTVDLAGYVVRRLGSAPDAEFVLPAGNLAPGDYLALSQAVLGFGGLPGDKLFLIKPGYRSLADAVEIHERLRGHPTPVSDEWWYPDRATFGAANSFEINQDIVINEIFYHAPPTYATASVPFREDPEQWIELYNRGSSPIDVGGWCLGDAIQFQFPSNQVIAPGGYLVIANDPETLRTKWPGVEIVGPFTNQLSHRSDRLILRDPNGNPVDRVRYFDDGRWPRAADGGGASLELRDPRADRDAAEAWAPSAEADRSAWRTYSYREVAQASAVGPDGQWHEFVLGLLDAGEVWLDDLSVIERSGVAPIELLQNGTFETGTNHWRILGNHHGAVIEDPDQPGNHVLHLIATGSTEHMSNHAETTLANNRDVVNGREYQVSFRARWLSGSPQLNTRLYFSRLARTTLLDIPLRHGTPGARNSAFTPNLGPTFRNVQHTPPVPAPSAPVTVSADVTDPDGVASATLWWRADGGVWLSAPMAPVATDLSRFQATFPGGPAGAIYQFYLTAADGRGASAAFPAAGPDSRMLCQMDDRLAATNGLHNVRLIALKADADWLHHPLNLMSNERVGATLIYDERDVYYNVGLRLKGSEHSRTTSARLGFNVGFDTEHRFRGIHSTVAIDRSESTGFGQREMLINQTLNHAGGVPTKYHDLIHVITPRREHTGSAELQLARYSNVFLDDQYVDGSQGTVFEYELVYQLMSTHDGTPEGIKVPAPDSFMGTALRNLGSDPEAYRWTLLIKNNEDRDDYRRIIEFCQMMELGGSAFQRALTNTIDVDQWLRGTAVNALSGAGDSYGGDGSAHNVQFYVRPSDQRVLYFPHDMDAFFDSGRPIVPNGDLAKIIAAPGYARAYYGHLLDIIATTYNGTYLAHWATQFGRLLPGQDFNGHLAFIRQRAAFVTSQVRAAVPDVPFAISTNGGNDFSSPTNVVGLSGNASLGIQSVAVNGTVYPVTWTGLTAWKLSVPLAHGVNRLQVEGLDHAGQPLGGAIDVITVTNPGPGVPQPVVINEWMAANRGPDGFRDPADGLFQDWFELFNPNAEPVDLGGYFLTDELSQPTKWAIPAGTVLGPQAFLLVWADNQTHQNDLHVSGTLHAPFQLNDQGEAIGLFAPDGSPQSRVVFGPQFVNLSQGCYPDGNTNRVVWMPAFTPGAPNSRAERLRILRIVPHDDVVEIVWTTVPGQSYRLEAAGDLLAGDWAPVGQERVADGIAETASDPVPGGGAVRFYRVRRID